MNKNTSFCLKTERLTIVPQSLKYLKSTHEYASDKQNMRFMVYLPNDTIEDTKNFLARAEEEWNSPAQSDFECAILRGGEHIGGISVTLSGAAVFGQEELSAAASITPAQSSGPAASTDNGFPTNAASTDNGRPTIAASTAPAQSTPSAELGWCLKKSAQGSGCAQEAAAALILWTHQTFGVTRFTAHCDTENIASWTTMENLGMKRVGRAGGRRNKLAPEEKREEFTYELELSDEWVTLSRFDMKNLPQVVDVVLPLWAPPSDDEDFARLDVEFIVRNNIYQPRLSFQLADKNRSPENELLSAAFFTLKDGANTARAWLEENSRACTDSQKASLKMVKAYLEYMDKKALSFMESDDIKLSLYVSRKRGCGAALLEKILPRLAAKGYKNLYLWTDSDCNWKWYVNHGYLLVSQEVYAPFSNPGRDYTTFVFKKPLL
ncbi:MAG: GNAT N-acetyltransferase [Treponema sp.]|nr:GNAT N-acetyltransferase [Treponema sp.]